MRTVRCPASTWWASARPAVNLAGRRRSALLVTLNLAAAAIYLVHLGLGDGHELPFTYPPFAALAFIPLTLLGYSAANWLLTAVTIVSIAASLWCFAVNTAAEAGARMRRLLP